MLELGLVSLRKETMYKQTIVLLDLIVGKAASLQGYHNVLSLLSYRQGRSALTLHCLT